MSQEEAIKGLEDILDEYCSNTARRNKLMAWHEKYSWREINPSELGHILERNQHQASDGTPHLKSDKECIHCANGIYSLLAFLNGKQEPREWCKHCYLVSDASKGCWYFGPSERKDSGETQIPNTWEHCPICGAPRPKP